MEFIIALFYLSGLIKGFVLFFEIPIPIDFTALSVLMIPLGLLFNQNRMNLLFDRKILMKQLLLISFYLWMIFTWSYSSSEVYKSEKTLLFFLNVIGFATPFFIKNFNIKLFLRLIFLSIFIFTFTYLTLFYYYLNNVWSKEEFDVLHSFYLQNGLVLGLQVIILILSNKPIFAQKKYDYTLAILSFILLLLLGSRGPLFSVIIVLVFCGLVFVFYKLKVPLFHKEFKLKPWNILFIFFCLLSVSISIFLFQDQILQLSNRSIIRLKLLVGLSDSSVQEGLGDSVSTRIEQIELSINYIFSDLKSFLFGEGVGSFGVLESGKDQRSYPHNVFLEIMVELGSIGLLFFLLFSYFITKNIKTKKYVTSWVILYIIINISKSNSIIDLRMFFILMAIYNLEGNIYVHKFKPQVASKIN